LLKETGLMLDPIRTVQALINELEGLLANYAFPIAITVYLLYRDSKKMDTLIELVKDLKRVVEEKT
jgi:hypothetical protein